MTTTLHDKLMLLFIVGWAGTAFGQPKALTLNPVQLRGSIVQVGPRSIAIKTDSGENWTLNLSEGRTKIKVIGSAEPEMLMKDTCVRFTARIDRRTSKAQEKIEKLTIFTPSPGVAERTIGVERVSEPAKKNEAGPAGPSGREPAPGAGTEPGPAASAEPEIVEDGSADAPSPKRRVPGAKGPVKSVPDVAAYDVCAKIVSYRNGRMVVAVKNRFFRPTLAVEVSPDVQIDLDLGNLSAAKPGDRIAAAGGYAKPGTCELTMEIQVALANPLAPPDTHPHGGRPGTHGSNAARRPGGKSRPGAVTVAGNNPAATAEEVAAKEPVEVEDPFKDQDKDNPPAKPKPETKPEPARSTDVAPPTEDTKPEPKKPDEKPSPKKPKKGPAVDDDKDVFEK